jgi:hypothetical protein
MANDRLYVLFDEQNKVAKDLIASAPKTINDLVSVGAADISGVNAQIDLSQRVVPSVDYSDYKNFVFFNSALDYFNISGDRIIREWPGDGTYSDQLSFLSASDPYQTYLADVWPRWHGYANFSGTNTYITANDAGIVDGNSYGGLLGLTNKMSGALTIEGHIRIDEMPAPGNVQIIVQRFSGTTETFTLYLDYNSLRLSVKGGAWRYERNMPVTVGSRWFAAVFDRDVSNNDVTMSFYTTDPTSDAAKTFQGGPYAVLPVNTYPAAIEEPANVSGKISVGVVYGDPGLTLFEGQPVVSPTFKLSELRLWNTAKTDHELFANYNLRVFSDPSLIAYWRFCEGYTKNNAVVKDYSGHGMHGKVFGPTTNFWVSSSLESDQANYFGMSPQDTGEYILPPNPQDDNTLWNFITAAQISGSLYDRDNTNIITNLVPYQFLYLEEDRNTEVLKNLLYLLGRQFDELKVKIDQFSKLLTVNYTGFNQTPETLLADAMKFWGWDSKGNFLSKEAFQHFFGYDALTSVPSPTASLSATYLPPAALNNQASYDNQRLDTVLSDIKKEFWKRTLNNLIYIYKTKGTKESVEALLRIYGLDDRLVKVKEFGLKQNVSIQTNRIASEKSMWAARLSGTNLINAITTIPYTAIPYTTVTSLQTQIRFPTEYYTDGPLTGSNQWNCLTGSIMGIKDENENWWQNTHELQYKRSPGSTSGTLMLTMAHRNIADLPSLNTALEAAGILSAELTGVPIFDGRWYSLQLDIFGVSPPTATLYIKHLDEDRIDMSLSHTFSIPGTIPLNYGDIGDFYVGRFLTVYPTGSEFWLHNTQYWRKFPSEVERNDHTLNPFSFGEEAPDLNYQDSANGNLAINWQFDKDVDHSQGKVWDSSPLSQYTPIAKNALLYERFSRNYNFIASPDYGWNEEKIRTFASSTVPYGSQWLESNAVSVEFNLIDALNEDISMMLSSMDNWNNVIGDPANRHRDTYPNLERFRQQYFSRLTGRINFRAFADFMDFFDRSFIDMIRKLLPARVNFKGAELVVESHMLERPKVQYTYRRHNPVLVPEGTITIVGHPSGVPVNVMSPYAPPTPEGIQPPINFRQIAFPTPAEPLWVYGLLVPRTYTNVTPGVSAYDQLTGILDNTKLVWGNKDPSYLPGYAAFISKNQWNPDGSPAFNVANTVSFDHATMTWTIPIGLDPATIFTTDEFGFESTTIWFYPVTFGYYPAVLDTDLSYQSQMIDNNAGGMESSRAVLYGDGFIPDDVANTIWFEEPGIGDYKITDSVEYVNTHFIKLTGARTFNTQNVYSGKNRVRLYRGADILESQDFEVGGEF